MDIHGVFVCQSEIKNFKYLADERKKNIFPPSLTGTGICLVPTVPI